MQVGARSPSFCARGAEAIANSSSDTAIGHRTAPDFSGA
jgi:hypothetical protein